MSGIITPLPNTPSWCRAELKARGEHYLLTFTGRIGRIQKLLAAHLGDSSGGHPVQEFRKRRRWVIS
jgi:hypothetical protein